MARKIVGIDLRVGSFYHRELWGAALCVAVSILAFAFVAVWVVFGASILLGLGNARRDTVVFLEGVFALILAPILGALLWRWGYYGLVRRPRELRIFDDGLVLVDVSGRELIVPYSDPSMDTLPWYVPPLSGPKAWMSVPGSGSMIWIPPEAMARINERRRPAGPGS